MVPRRVCCRDGRPASPAARPRLSPSRASSAPAASSLTLEAASSIASGSPSSRPQMAAMSAALPAVKAKPGRTMAACWTNSRAAPHAATSAMHASRGTSSGGTGSSCSPCRCSGRRDVASTTRPGAAASSPAATPAAPVQLLQVIQHQQRPAIPQIPGHRVGGGPVTGRHPGRRRSAFHITSASRTAASATKNTPCGKASSSDAAAASASRVLPTPPVPVSVTSRTPGRISAARSCSRSPLPADQRRQRHRQAGLGTQALQRREPLRQARNHQLADPLRHLDVLQPVPAQIPHRHPGRQP